MGSKLGQQQNLKQNLSMEQILNLTTVLAMPVGAIDFVLDSIASNAPEVEKTLDLNDAEYSLAKGAQTLYRQLHKKSDPVSDQDRKNIGGVITLLSAKNLEKLVLNDKIFEIMPDVEYTGREGEKPILEYAQCLVERPQLKNIQISAEFHKTKKIYDFLMRQRLWINQQLIKIYQNIGEKQREFIEILDPAKLNKYPMEKLSENIGLSLSTVSRLLKERYALVISHKGKKEIHHIKHFLPNEYKFKRHQAIHKMNKVFEEESKRRIAYSDLEIYNKIAINIERRTLAKYRKEEKIPTALKRKQIYIKQSSKIFKIPHFIDNFLQLN